jgi:D-tyrosyl-tRNA(Tyr) deacylase
MKVVIQRCAQASVTIENKIHSNIGKGLLVLLGIEALDEQSDVSWLIGKLIALRIFSDEDGKMNHSIEDVNGSFLIVSQFTLHASTKKGNRPSYTQAARLEVAIPLYEYFVSKLKIESNLTVETGVFGADMQIGLINDGPVTIIIDSKNRV